MLDVSGAMKAKSDQLNFVDLGVNGELLITIDYIDYAESREQQQIWIYYQGCNKRPYKPSVGMGRLLVGAWGKDADKWVGKQILLYGEKEVTFGKGEVGGIRIRALSDVPKEGYVGFVQKNKRVRTRQTIPLLVVEADPITENDQNWIDLARQDITVLDQIENDDAYKARIKSLI